MSVMSCRVLRSTKAILQSYDELLNTPKESENEDALEKKIKKKRIRRTKNSFLIDDSCKREKTQNGRYNTESSNSKPKTSRKKDCSLVFDSSSDYDSVFEDEEVSSRKTRKTEKKIELPTFQLDDFQQYNRKMQKLRQESDTNNSKSSKECSNTSNVVHKNKKIKQNRMENKTPKQKDSASLIPTDVKIKNEGNTSLESVYFIPSPMEKINCPIQRN
ncbi:hypothetical protein WA026_005204 [Henosepilachna vigintioctopunctata]|uniref:Uncharacterized protein n=1 Tax=Henosepilachna vigintioctopunctata TaxID=420089 RepID=A0AAW1UMG4_9CUCU